MIVISAKGKICIMFKQLLTQTWYYFVVHEISCLYRTNTSDKDESNKQPNSVEPDNFNYGYAEPGEVSISKKMKLGIKV